MARRRRGSRPARSPARRDRQLAQRRPGAVGHRRGTPRRPGRWRGSPPPCPPRSSRPGSTASRPPPDGGRGSGARPAERRAARVAPTSQQRVTEEHLPLAPGDCSRCAGAGARRSRRSARRPRRRAWRALLFSGESLGDHAARGRDAVVRVDHQRADAVLELTRDPHVLRREQPSRARRRPPSRCGSPGTRPGRRDDRRAPRGRCSARPAPARAPSPSARTATAATAISAASATAPMGTARRPARGRATRGGRRPSGGEGQQLGGRGGEHEQLPRPRSRRPAPCAATAPSPRPSDRDDQAQHALRAVARRRHDRRTGPAQQRHDRAPGARPTRRPARPRCPPPPPPAPTR